MNTTETISRLARELDALLPYGHAVELQVRRCATNTQHTELMIHGVKSYAEAQDIFRALGIQRRDKSVWNDHAVRTVLQGDIAPGIHLVVFCEGLPPSCRIEKFVERVPKQQTVDTGDFIEVERSKIVCGAEKDVA